MFYAFYSLGKFCFLPRTLYFPSKKQNYLYYKSNSQSKKTKDNSELYNREKQGGLSSHSFLHLQR